MKTATIKLQGKDYAQVKDRMIEFRGANPRGLIETTPTINPDGTIIFKARILKDKGDLTSAEATGHALGQNKGIKAFEKLETIAVGRALALLGYGSDGDIASSEEMEEFEQYKEEKTSNLLEDSKNKLEKTKNLKELSTVWGSLPGEVKPALDAFKNELKQKYANTPNEK
jgi:hypothetical protein